MSLHDFVSMIGRSSQQQSFFHFTDGSNVASILQHGLLSMRELRRLGLAHTPGGNQLSQDLDIHHGMDAYVHLCFRQNHGMAHQASTDGRIKDLRWLRIDPRIVLNPGVLVVLDNAVKNDVQPRPIADALGEIDVEVLYTRTDWRDPEIRGRLNRAERYELLVPTAVPSAYIR